MRSSDIKTYFNALSSLSPLSHKTKLNENKCFSVSKGPNLVIDITLVAQASRFHTIIIMEPLNPSIFKSKKFYPTKFSESSLIKHEKAGQLPPHSAIMWFH